MTQEDVVFISKALEEFNNTPKEKLIEDIKRVYSSYQQGKERKELFYAKCAASPTTIHHIIYGLSYISFENYVQIMAIGVNPNPHPNTIHKKHIKRFPEERAKYQKEYQHNYYMTKIKQKRRKRDGRSGNV